MSEWYKSGACGECACIPVCAIYNATGGVVQCKYKVAKTLNGEWIYAPCEDDETVWVYHCNLCGALSAQMHPYCRGCRAEMKMEDKA
jgi:hypothetical protein